jgi:hypothetical protein
MTSTQIIIAFPDKNSDKIKSVFPGDKQVSWLYLGKDYSKRRIMAQSLGERFKIIDIASLHDQVAKDIRFEFVHWVDDLNRKYGGSIDWWFGSIPSRDIYNSTLFQYFCYLVILDRLCKIQEVELGLVIVESAGLAKSIEKWASTNSIDVRIIGSSGTTSSLYTHIFFLWIKFFISLLLRWIAAVSTRFKSRGWILQQNGCIIVDTFIHENSLSEEGVFEDRYFPFLHEYLKQNGKTVLVHPVLHGFRFNYFSIYSRMRKSNTLFIIPEDYLQFSDYLASLIYPLRCLRQHIKVKSFLCFDVADIVREEQRSTAILFGMHPALIFRLFLRLGEGELKPEAVIDWYENQVIDKALIAGCRKVFPGTYILGAQLYTHAMNDLHLFPSESEVEFRVAPDVLLETSPYQCERVKSFTQAIPCVPAAALRYGHIFRDRDPEPDEIGQKSILVLLPFYISQAIELLEVVKESLVGLRSEMRIVIKCHPDYKSQDIIEAFGKDQWPSRFNIFEGGFQEALAEAALIVSSNTSSMVEAAAKGIPVIFVGSQTALNHNPLENLGLDIHTECFTSDELIQAVDKYVHPSAADADDFKKMGRRVRDLFFTPINENTMESFLGKNQRQSH